MSRIRPVRFGTGGLTASALPASKPAPGSGSQAQARAIFKRALEGGSLLLADLVAKQVGPLDLREALEFTALIAKHDRARAHDAKVRWLRAYLNETEGVTVSDCQLVISRLAALGSPSHDSALTLLRKAAKQARAKPGRRPSS
jgi:hypothetical protein